MLRALTRGLYKVPASGAEVEAEGLHDVFRVVVEGVPQKKKKKKKNTMKNTTKTVKKRHATVHGVHLHTAQRYR